MGAISPDSLIRHRLIQWGFFALVIITRASPAVGQNAALPEQPLLGSTLTADFLRDLPTGNSPFAVLETIQPESVGDRFSSDGLNVAAAPRFGAFLNSWTQTQYRIGDVTVTDPRAGGTPLVLPTLSFWERVTALTGAAGVDDSAPGLSMTLEPLRPGAKWFRAVEASVSAPPLASEGPGPPPAFDRVDQWLDGRVLVSGPASDRLGLIAAGSWRGLSHVAAPSTHATRDHATSGFAHLVFAATPRDEIRALGWAQQAATAALTDTSVHVQSTWERRDASRLAWRLFGGYSERSRTAPMPATLVVDSLASDPVSDLIDPGSGTARRWVLGARVTPPRTARAWPTVGIDLEGAQMHVEPTGLEQVRELVDGVAARQWTFHAGTGPDGRHLTTLAVYASEHVTSGRLTFDAGVRLDAVTGAADASAQGIRWTTWLPRTMVGWHIADTGGLELVGGYRRSAYQLPLNVLAIGDAAAPVADIAAWNGTSAGPLIARVGPGTGGDTTFTQIDPQLQRPTTDELVFAVQSRPTPWLQLQATGIAKRENALIGLVDTGLPVSAYSSFQVPDPSFVPGSPVGTPQVTVYNRPPGGYGRDRYLLTNQADDPATFWGTDVSIRVSTDRLVLLAGGTVWTRTFAPAAAVGYLPTENDQDLAGNLFVDPNAATMARGQLFQDRSHTVKVAGVCRFPWGIRLGATARYQDGQPFARLVVVPNLTQGATAVRAFKNGGSAFTYTGTLDIRVQKAITTGPTQVTAVLDVYNLPGLANEVTERVVSGATYRTPTALQPPRTVVLGLRATF